MELPRLYSEWTNLSHLFDVRICQYLSIIVPISEVAQSTLIMSGILGIWMRQRRVSRFSTNLGKNFFHLPISLKTFHFQKFGQVE